MVKVARDDQLLRIVSRGNGPPLNLNLVALAAVLGTHRAVSNATTSVVADIMVAV